MVASIIIVEDLHPSYILNRKSFNTKHLLCLSLFTDEHKPSLSLFTFLADANRGGRRPTTQLRSPIAQLRLKRPLSPSSPPWPTQIEEAGGQRRNLDCTDSATPTLLAQPHCYWARNNPHYIGTTPIVLYFKVYVLILFSFQDLTMLLLFRSCFNFLFCYGLTFG